jgi:hypothetical protein
VASHFTRIDGVCLDPAEDHPEISKNPYLTYEFCSVFCQPHQEHSIIFLVRKEPYAGGGRSSMAQTMTR